MHRTSILNLALILAACLAAGAADPEPARLVEAGRYREALARFEAQPEPGDGGRILLGRILLGLGRYQEAEAKLAAPGPPAAEPARLEALSRIAEARGDLDRAISTMAEAVEARQKGIASVESLDGASLLSEARTRLGAVLFRAGRLDPAKEQFQKAISLVNDAHARLHAADVPHDERDPRLVAGGATAGLARVYGAQGDAARAERSWRGIMARTDDPAVLMDLASYYLAKGDAKSAQRHLDRALRLTEGKPAHRASRALMLAGKPEARAEALALAEAVHADGPDAHACDTLAWVLHLRGDHERAAAILAPVLALGCRDALILYHAGRIAEARGQADEAKRLYALCLEINPGFDPVASADARKRLGRS
ncbi:tetratricopeptide repeat protein [Tundrisphaera sp. TA3]|uniref:tetratricopeptide repeat protein n=1 Tax=Tundrisphaera sp. TA3 TaxID=3435775 RepID=UPI003EBD6BE0